MTNDSCFVSMPSYEEYGEKARFWLITGTIIACICALIYTWIPTSVEKDAFRTNLVDAPAIGHWIDSPEEYIAVRDELTAMEHQAHHIPVGKYTAEAYVAEMKRIDDLKRSTPPEIYINKYHAAFRGFTISRELPLMFNNTEQVLVNEFGRAATGSAKNNVSRLAEASGLTKHIDGSVEHTDWHFVALMKWMLHTHLQSMLIVLFFFVARAEIVGQKKRILFYDAPRTVLWMFFWPVGIWIYPTSDALAVVKAARKHLILAFRFLMGTTIPNLMFAQSAKTGDVVEKKRNSLNASIEGVNKYHSMGVGEVFQKDPGARLAISYGRDASFGTFHVDSWNSVGRGNNTESDLGFGVTHSGFDYSFTHLFVRGGDAEALTLSKSGTAHLRGFKIPLNANLNYFYGTSATSPPGGISFKLGSGFSHKLPLLSKELSVAHDFAVAGDNNPFKLGKGLSGIGFYSGEARFKGAYFDWKASLPLLGRDNTSRGFRHSIAAGYRVAHSW